MGSKSKSIYLLLLILLVSVGASAASFIVEREKVSCNGTFGLGDCFSFSGNSDELELEGAGGEELLLRHYAAGARWLLQTRSITTQRALQPGAVCSTSKYADCIQSNNGGNSRPCANYNRCKRG